MTTTDSSKGAALVTGAGTRIGAQLARTLAAAGYPVVVHYRSSRTGAETVVAGIRAEGGIAFPVQADLESRSERETLIATAADLAGPLTVLVNNASRFEPDSVETLDETLWATHFALHAEAPLFLSRDFARQLPEGRSGNIVNIIDARLLAPTPAYTSYALSKGVLWMATRTMAQEFAPKIRVNAIGPGPTLPEQGKTEEKFLKRVAQLPLQRGANPKEVGEALLYVLRAPALTGQMLALDGGGHLEWPERANPTPRRP